MCWHVLIKSTHIDPIQYVLEKKSIEKCKQNLLTFSMKCACESIFIFEEGNWKWMKKKSFFEIKCTCIYTTATSIMLAAIYILVLDAWQQHRKYPTKTTKDFVEHCMGVWQCPVYAYWKYKPRLERWIIPCYICMKWESMRWRRRQRQQFRIFYIAWHWYSTEMKVTLIIYFMHLWLYSDLHNDALPPYAIGLCHGQNGSITLCYQRATLLGLIHQHRH